MTSHAAASPSSAEMWLNCPASITQAKDLTRPSSRFAKEGSAAHTIAEMILSGELFPPGRITIEGSAFIVGLPMLRALNPYVDFVQRLRDSGAVVRVEQRVVLNWAGGIVWGTADCIARNGGTLDIVDLKYGEGIPIKPDHPQLRIYALAAIHTFFPAEHFDTVNLTVIQPRIDPTPKTYSTGSRELRAWGQTVLKPAIMKINMNDPTEKYGHWCRWCVRKDDCKAFKVHKAGLAAEIFDDGVDTLQ